MADKEKLMDEIHTKFEECVEHFLNKKDSTEIVEFLKEYYHCIKLFKNPSPVSVTQIDKMVTLMAEGCKLASEDKQFQIDELEKRRDVLDEEDVDAYREALDEIEKVFLYTMEVAGQYMRIYKEDVTEFMKQKLLPLFIANFNKSENTEHEIIDSMCFLIDCCEFLSLQFFSEIYEESIKKFVEIYHSHKENEDRDVVQSLSFGLGVIASRIPPEQFTPYAQQVVGLLEEVISVPDNMNDDNSYATENALSSLLKIAYFQKDGTLVTDAHVKKYLSMLPLREDLDEALAVNKLLIEQVEKKNANLLGEGNCNGAELEQALNRIAQFHHEDPELKTLDEEYAERLSKVLS
jgi:antitoxin component HigA of HigAB toxin-antitoxin module